MAACGRARGRLFGACAGVVTIVAGLGGPSAKADETWPSLIREGRAAAVALYGKAVAAEARLAKDAAPATSAEAEADETWPSLIRRGYAAAAATYERAVAAEKKVAAAAEPAGPAEAGTDHSWWPLIGRGYAAARTLYRRAVAADAALAERQAAAEPSLNRLITEASARFNVPERLIRAVMRVESNGNATAISPKGAMGLMQVMPGTYADLSDRYYLGGNPYAPRNNILAGSAYLREMYDRFGSTGVLAAYNAGPGRYEDYLHCKCALPDETQRYVAAVREALGEVLFSQPNSAFYEPLAISSRGEFLLRKTGKPMPVEDRLALHSLVARAVQRANAK